MPESPAPSPTVDPYARSSYGTASPGWGGGRIEMKERPFIVGLLLTIVTIGIYPLFWHFLTHDELHRQMGRENKDQGVWYGYVAATIIPWFILIFLGVQFIGLMIATGTAEPNEEELFHFLMGAIIWIVLLVVLGIVALVLYTIYVLRQWELLKQAKERMGLQLRASTGAFFGLYFGGLAIQTLTSIPAMVVTSPIAYYFLQENYNDIPRAIQHGQVDAPAYGPGGEGWQRGPTRAATGGPAPVAYNPAYMTPPPAYGTPHAPQHHGGMPSSSWDAPGQFGAPPGPPERQAEPGGGFSIRERTPVERAADRPLAPGTHLVEQSFQCPRCHTHVTARGPGGESVTVHCPHCAESGTVRLPEA